MLMVEYVENVIRLTKSKKYKCEDELSFKSYLSSLIVMIYGCDSPFSLTVTFIKKTSKDVFLYL